MHKHMNQVRSPNGSPPVRGQVKRWNSFHGGGNFETNPSNVNGERCLSPKSNLEPYRAVPKAVQVLRSESVDRGHRIQPPPPPAFPRRRFSVCIGGDELSKGDSCDRKHKAIVQSSPSKPNMYTPPYKLYYITKLTRLYTILRRT
ncbi:hypothetical protein KQX54_021587 [Cotesia glomerata]|uniref:Uncharacterized protein n=1 Tax=Cotesia glomerata TaxID=32391 RepID=A0AAV7J7K2_COTGL|nr:hypothetical protein KQX54_021587 [Cotesia glomerata]